MALEGEVKFRFSLKQYRDAPSHETIYITSHDKNDVAAVGQKSMGRNSQMQPSSKINAPQNTTPKPQHGMVKTQAANPVQKAVTQKLYNARQPNARSKTEAEKSNSQKVELSQMAKKEMQHTISQNETAQLKNEIMSQNIKAKFDNTISKGENVPSKTEHAVAVPNAITRVQNMPQRRLSSKSAVHRKEKRPPFITGAPGKSSSQKPRAKTSVGVPTRKTTLSEMFRQIQTIDVKGRPFSAPQSENGPENKTEIKLNDKQNKRTSAALSKRLSAKRNDDSTVRQTASATKREETQIPPKATSLSFEQRPKSPKELLQENMLFGSRRSTPFWFYRSKTDVLLNQIDDTPPNKITHAPSAPATPRDEQRGEDSLDDINKPKSLIPKIYVFDAYRKEFITCGGSPRTPRTPREADKTPRDKINTKEEQTPEEKEVVDLLRRNHRNRDSPRQPEVMRTLPLQSDLEKYTWYLESDKHRNGRFTNSLNRYVPGFFKIETNDKKVLPKVIRPARATTALSEPVPAKSMFMTQPAEELPINDSSVLQGIAVDLNA